MLRFVGGTLGPTVFALVLQASGPELTTSAFRVDFYMVAVMATMAVLVGLRVPGTTYLEETCITEE